VEHRDPLIDRLATALRQPVATGSAGVDRALVRLRREAQCRRWLRRGAAGGLAAGIAAILALLRPGAPPAAAVRFELADTTRGPVALIGDFNDWNPRATPLGHGDQGWSTVLRLKPGRYRYAFVVAGSSWRADPRSPAAEDDFGTPTSVITVTN
jgi:hypothetical protein